MVAETQKFSLSDSKSKKVKFQYLANSDLFVTSFGFKGRIWPKIQNYRRDSAHFPLLTSIVFISSVNEHCSQYTDTWLTLPSLDFYPLDALSDPLKGLSRYDLIALGKRNKVNALENLNAKNRACLELW